MLFFLVISWVQFVASSIHKQTTLNGQTQSQNGASIHHNPDSVTISDNNYTVNVVSQFGYDLKLSLTDSWTFSPTANSTLTLTINGHTPYPHIDTDMILVFAVADWQYFSFFLHLDYIHNIKTKIFSNLSLNKINNSVMSWMSEPNATHLRWDRVSNNDQWSPFSNIKTMSEFPLKFVIKNDPINGKAYFTFYHSSTQSYIGTYAFKYDFVSNAPMDVYIMGDSLTETFVIYSFDIQLTVDSTLNPTDAPTYFPSNMPTISPTVFPTVSPSDFPTDFPTFAPTVKPTETVTHQTIWQKHRTTNGNLTSEEHIDTTNTQITTNFKFELSEKYNTFSFWLYASTILIMCFIVCLCICIFIIKCDCQCCRKAEGASLRIMRGTYSQKMKSRSMDDIDRDMSLSNMEMIDGNIQSMAIIEEIEELQSQIDCGINNELKMISAHKSTLGSFEDYGENANLKSDEFVVDSYSTKGGMNGEYEMEGNDENNNEANSDNEIIDTSDFIGCDDEFVVMSDNDNDCTLGNNNI